MTTLEREHSAAIGAALAILAHADPALKPVDVGVVDAAVRRLPEGKRLDMIVVAENYRRIAQLAEGDPIRAKQQALKIVKTLKGVDLRREALGLLVEAMPSGDNPRRQRAMKDIAEAFQIPTAG